MHKNNLQCMSMGLTSKGFVLPTVLIVSLIMISALTLTLNVVWSGRQSLKQQFDTQNARNAAISGINIADGCRYGNDIIISDTITASNSPSNGTKDCGRTAATASVNPFLLKPEYGSAVSSFGFSANFIKDSSGAPVLITATGGNKGTSSGSFSKQGRPTIAANSVYTPPPPLNPNIQSITKATCPTTRTMAVDARDKHTYWIQKLADGNCWMLTNLAYAGGTSNGGTNTYSDVINQGTGTPGTPGTLNNGTADTERTFTLAKYYVHAAANPTIDPTPPSTDTTGGGSGAGRQYGYYYNWCAVMGGQNTAACANAETPAPDPTTNICPAGWRLPTGGSGGELEGLNTAINGGLTDTDAVLRTNGLFQRSGYWYNGFNNQGSYGYYWSISQYSSTSARSLYLGSTLVYPAYYSYKYNGFAVRCVAL